jgi:hypothetical protein
VKLPFSEAEMTDLWALLMPTPCLLSQVGENHPKVKNRDCKSMRQSGGSQRTAQNLVSWDGRKGCAEWKGAGWLESLRNPDLHEGPHQFPGMCLQC